MGDGAGGLSDVLRRMAEGKHRRAQSADDRTGDAQETPPPPARPASRRPGEPADAARPAHRSAAPPPNASGARPTATTSTTPARRPAAPPAHDGLKAAAIPVCLTTAALLLIPAGWSILVLAGFDVWRSDWPNARRMAYAMLGCLPLALALIGGAAFLRGQLQHGR